VNFLNVGPWELVVTLIIAILLVGPRRMVEIAQSIGRVTSQMRSLSHDFLGAIQNELQTTEQEALQAMDGLAEGGADLSAQVQATERETSQALTDIEQDRAQATASIQAEIHAVEREARQALDEIAESFEGIVKGKQETQKGQDEQAGTE
jgi:Sec-independent protein translocase protein TatA